MHRFDRRNLSPELTVQRIDTVDAEENGKLAEWIALIAVIDDRRDYLAAGYSSLKAFCKGRLRKSEDQALRRIQIARAALQVPELFECLADGRLGVTTASILAPHLTPETAAELLLAAAAFRTKHEIVRMLVERRRRPAAAPAAPAGGPAVESCSTSHAPAHVNSLSDLAAPPAGEPDVETTSRQRAPAHVENPRRGRVTQSATGGAEVRLALTDAEYEDLRAAQALLGHAVPSGDPALIYARAMKLYRAHLEKRRLGVKPGAAVPAGPGRGRGIPKALLRLVWERDGGRCAFVSADGHRCEETARLEVDHVTPFARGGQATSDNLRLLCRAHNQYEAERVLGKEYVQTRRELAQRERARDRVAAQAEAARAKARDQAAAGRSAAPAEARQEVAGGQDSAPAPAGNDVATETSAAQRMPRDAAHQARYDDIHAALRGLGWRESDARWGAERADAMPDASLEECLKTVMGELARPIILRGERLARCTA